MNYTAEGGINIDGSGTVNEATYVYTVDVDTIEICGKSIYSNSIFIYTRYGPGNIVFNKKKALKGIVEKICIKKVFIRDIPRSYSYNGVGVYPMYKDTLNGIWFEEDIVDQATALALIDFYLESQGIELSNIECN